MKINPFMFFISLIISGLIFFGFYKWDGDMLVTLGSSIMGLVLLSTTFSLTSKESGRSAVMIKVMSGLLFAILLVVNILFAKYDVSSTTFIMTNGIVLCLWAVMFYGMARAGQ